MTAAGRTRWWKCAADYTLTGLLGWVSVDPVSIRELSLKELRALAQQRLGARAAELKTRQELIDSLEATEKKKVPRTIVPLAPPLPAPVAVVPPKELPPEPMIWTADAPLPQITARPAVPEFPVPAKVWSESPDSAPEKFSTAEVQPDTVTQHFFLEPDKPRLPVTYGDNRVLTFARDPKTLYAAWDFSSSNFDQGTARGQVVNKAGVPVQSFAVEGPAGGVFVEGLAPGATLKVEVRGGSELIGESGWVTMPSVPAAVEAPVNAPSSVV